MAFFLLGLITTAVCGWLLANWLEIAGGVFGMNVIYDTRPAWLRALMAFLEKVPLAVLAMLTAVRLARGPVVRPLAFAAGVASMWAFGVGSMLLGPGIEAFWHRRDFESVVWRSNERRDEMWPARLTMIDDLLAHHQLRGLSRDSLQQLLGPGDSKTYWPEWDFVYWLGPERGLVRIDSEWLVLRVNGSGYVSDFRVVRD